MKEYDIHNTPQTMLYWGGQFLSDELQARGISIKEFAKMANFDCDDLQAYIKGKKNITKQQSAQIGRALDIPEDFFFNWQTNYYTIKNRPEKEKVAFFPSFYRITKALYRHIACL